MNLTPFFFPRRWLYLRCGIFAVWFPTIAIMGCAGGSSSQAAGSGAFIKAEVSNAVPGDPKRPFTVSGPKLRTLLRFFPDLDKRNAWAGAWAAGTKVLLFRADGSTVRIYINSERDTWSQGGGDWPLKRGFAKFIAEERTAQGQASARTMPSPP